MCNHPLVHKKMNPVPVLKYYMQITITINSISKKIKKGKNSVKQEDNNHKNPTRYNKYICVVLVEQ